MRLRLAALPAAVAAVTIVFLAVVASSQQGANGELPDGYWRFPLAAQGSPPPGWSEVEQSLRPEDCGTCHAARHDEWRTSVHAHAFSPGLLGQLLTLDERAEVEACMNCHAPLAEQKRQFFAESAGIQSDDPTRVPATAGNSCAGCHVREHRRFGPPAAAGHQVATGAVAHGGVTRSAAFERSDFCAGCHQFPSEAAVNGKPLENTFVEWRASRFAAEGRTCQSCHMPGRRHLFRGIHDPSMVASGLTAQVSATPAGARFSLTSIAIGHAFPTYATPRVVMSAVALDGRGQEVPGTLREHVIQRSVRYTQTGWRELSDTRLLPGEMVSLDAPWNEYDSVRVWLEVFPDEYYQREVYPDLLKDLASGSPPSTLIKQAMANAERSRYRLFEQTVRRPR